MLLFSLPLHQALPSAWDQFLWISLPEKLQELSNHIYLRGYAAFSQNEQKDTWVIFSLKLSDNGHLLGDLLQKARDRSTVCWAVITFLAAGLQQFNDFTAPTPEIQWHQGSTDWDFNYCCIINQINEFLENCSSVSDSFFLLPVKSLDIFLLFP